MNAKELKRLKAQAKRMDYWDRVFAILDALPSCARECDIVTDEHGMTHHVPRPQTFKVNR
jgi:hypothetical protein